MQKEQIYLVRKQEETERQLSKLEQVHGDLVDEYNKLLGTSKELYQEFFDTYYQLKLKSNKSQIIWPFREKDLEQLK